MKFTFREDNRKVQRKHVEDIKASIKAHGYLTHSPIVLNEEGEIIDGQHRYIACCELGIIPPTITLKSADNTLMVDLNRSQKAWGIEDFINFFAQAGKYSYVLLKEFCAKTKLATTPALKILLDDKFKSFDSIRDGSLMIKVRETDMDSKYQIANDINTIARLIKLHKGNKTITEAYMILIMLDGFDREYFMQKMKRYRDRLSLCGSTKSYLQMFVSVYNYKEKEGLLTI